MIQESPTQMVVEDYGTPNHGNSPLHNQEFLIQQSNDIH